jgi:hypothetical protein
MTMGAWVSFFAAVFLSGAGAVFLAGPSETGATFLAAPDGLELPPPPPYHPKRKGGEDVNLST